MYLFFYMGLDVWIWMGGIHFSGRLKGWALKSRLFWAQMAFCLALQAEIDPADVICSVIDGPYHLPWRTVPSAQARAAQLRAVGISSCRYTVHTYVVTVNNQPS